MTMNTRYSLHDQTVEMMINSLERDASLIERLGDTRGAERIRIAVETLRAQNPRL